MTKARRDQTHKTDEFKWEQFIRDYTYRERSAAPEATVWRKNLTLCFRAAAVNAFNLNNSRYAETFYDRKRQALGFRFHSKRPDDHSNTILATKSKSNLLLSMKPVFRKFGIDAEGLVNKTLTVTEEEGLIVVNLKNH